MQITHNTLCFFELSEKATRIFLKNKENTQRAQVNSFTTKKSLHSLLHNKCLGKAKGTEQNGIDKNKTFKIH